MNDDKQANSRSWLAPQTVPPATAKSRLNTPMRIEHSVAASPRQWPPRDSSLLTPPLQPTASSLQTRPAASSNAPELARTGSFASTTNHPVKLMISYSWDDKVVVHFVAQVLRDNKFEVWLDNMNSKVQFNDAIAKAINSADAVIVFISESSAKSYYCNLEVNYATDMHKAIVPVRLTKLPILNHPTLDFLTAGKL
ncbi:hypothetical protein HK100_009189, partial [Physocladia obscura]